MSSYVFSALTSRVPRSPAPSRPEPLDRERFEHLSVVEAEALLASRFRSFTERGCDWREALLLAVRPDTAPVPHSGDVQRY